MRLWLRRPPCLPLLQETVVNVSTIFLAEDSSPVRRAPLVNLAKELLGDYLRLVRWGRAGEGAEERLLTCCGAHMAAATARFVSHAAVCMGYLCIVPRSSVRSSHAQPADLHVPCLPCRRALADNSSVVVQSAARLAEASAEGHCMPANGEEPASLKFLTDWGVDNVAVVRAAPCL